MAPGSSQGSVASVLEGSHGELTPHGFLKLSDLAGALFRTGRQEQCNCIGGVGQAWMSRKNCSKSSDMIHI